MRRSAATLLLVFSWTVSNPTLGRAEKLADQARTILQTHCASCHGPDKPRGGFGFILDRARLVAREKIVPGKAAESELVQRIDKGEMPPPGKKPRPSAAEIALLRRWIDAGAPDFSSPETAPVFVTNAALLRTILTDVQNLDPRRRRFTRYLTLTHLANARFPAGELQAHRHALAKLVNSLSWHPRITAPQPVDAAQTIYRLDLRDYKWSARQWDRLAAAYPYRLTSGSDTAKTLAQETECEQPILRGDWFVAVASRPPFYFDFLQLPATDRALERLLQVDVAADWQEDRAARAGFNGSGVARNNRVIERHDAAFGAYWRSYDFADNTGRQNIFEHPLGPVPLPNAFRHAGGEIIFGLPNGLHGYLLVDANGRRVDKAPGEIVSDPRRPDRLVETGVSCLSCHVRGLLPKDDQVRAHVLKNRTAFAPAELEMVKALYPSAERFRRLMDEDVERYLRALEKAGVPATEPEPVTTVVSRYEGLVDLTGAAAETGLPPAEFILRLRQAATLSRTLGNLLAKGGTVQRQAFEEAFPELAKTLVSGEDVNPATAPTRTAPFAGHEGAVLALAFAPDGRFAVSGGEDRTVRFWDVATGKERQCFKGHSDDVLAVAFSPDGKVILSGSRDRTLRLWDTEQGKEIRRFLGHTDGIRAVAFAPDGRQALSASADGSVRVWDLATGKELHVLPGHKGPVRDVAVSPDGRLALSAGYDKTVRLWDLTAGKEKARWEGHAAEVFAVAFSPDGRRAVSGGNDRTVRLWDVATGEELRQFKGHANAIIRVAFSADGRFLRSASSRYQTADAVFRTWEIATGKEVQSSGDFLEGVGCIAFSPDGRRALVQTAVGLRLLPVSGDR
jgi:mono/diheme cytochrome c family protein